MSSAICPRFAQNAWKKDLCSNCFKSKEEHKSAAAQTKLTKTTATLIKKTESAVKLKPPPKGIIKGPLNKVNKNFKVNFTKELTQVIGYGGEWSDADSGDEDDDFYNPMNANDDLTSTDDDDNLELKRLTKNNTDFNTNNGNLLGDPEENIKKTFAALKLGAPLVDKEGKKQTLKISVVPFGAPSKLSSVKAKFEQKRDDISDVITKKIEKSSISAPSFSTSTAVASSKVIVKSVEMKQNPKVVTKQLPPKIVAVDGKSSPPIERAMEKSLLEEISETLELKQQEVKKFQSDKDGKIKFEISSLSDSMNTKTFPDLKKPIARNAPITKDQIKPKINVFTKFSDSESNCSDNENGISAYYDVVETTCGYENLPDGKVQKKDQPKKTADNGMEEKSSVFSSSQYITDMLLSAKTRAASYSLHEGNFMTSKITSDGLIVTKCSSDDALDSTGSSFDGSSDEETSYNMNKSESDSGIGISIGSEYKLPKEKERTEKKLSASTNNSDYEDIQVIEQTQGPKIVGKTPSKNFLTEKSREMAGEPDGSADPDGNGEIVVPALPKTPPPITSAEVRPSFLHGMQKNIANKKPDLPVKPTTVSVLKTFTKRQPTSIEKQVITQLQQVIKAPANDYSQSEKLTLTRKEGNDQAKLLKKGRAPDPPPTTGDEKLSAPPTPEKDYSTSFEYSSQFDIYNKKPTITTDLDHDTDDNENENEKENDNIDDDNDNDNNNDNRKQKFNSMLKIDETSSLSQQIQQQQQHLSIYTRNPIVGTKTTSPVIREKDKRERATINPKFRSLNTFNSQRNKITTQLIKPSTPEPTPRKNLLSMSEECLTASSHIDDKKKKTKFSIKKFLRMGTSKTTDNLHKKDGIYSEIVTGDEAIVSGKPRLVIIHPIDINPTAVEVVKDISQTNESTGGVSSSSPLASPTKMKTVNVLTTKPPAPPQRAVDSMKSNEINKPARPPPPKSAELRRKQKIGFNVNTNGGSVKCKSDNVYANLGEIRSAMAPRKPERTASMREREAQLELARKRHGYENSDTISICSSNGGNVSNEISINPGSPTPSTHSSRPTITDVMSKESFSISQSTASSRNSTTERRKQIENDTNKVSSKLEIFEKTISESNKSNSLKDSVRKINSTIDSYLKDKRDYENMYDFVKTSGSPSLSPSPAMGPPTPPARSNDTAARNMQRRMHFQDNISVNGANYTRSEYGPRYGLTNSLANIPRVISASYCGSEMGESDIYSPYSYYGSEAGGDVAMTNDINDSVWGIPSTTKSRTKTTNRLRMRKGRSVVHKTIEDNYSAVVVANHEALAQVLDQLQQTPVIPPALRSLANAINLRFEDFTVLDGVQPFVVGKKAFHAAVWTTTPVSLALSVDCNQLSGVGGELSQQLSGGVSGVLNPITEFCDLVPSYNLPLMPSTEVRMLQATISVLPRLQLETLQSIGMILKNKSDMLEKTNFNFRGSIPNLSGQKEQGSIRNVCSVQNLTTLNEENLEKCDDLNSPLGMPSYDDVMCREVGFIMLQLVNGLKNLQAKAIEEMPLSLSNVVLSKEIDNKDAQARLCVIQGNNNDEDEPMGTLCKCAHVALTEMLPHTKLTPILSEILIQERSESLSKAKAVLEFALWGPSDVILTGLTKERELALQRWLDLERATVLHGLVRTRIELTVYDECHLMFLVRSNAKMMNDAAKIFSSYQNSN